MWTDSLYRLQSEKEVAVDFDLTDTTQRILIANVNRTHELTIQHYCEYLLTLQDRFTHIAVLIHNDNRWQAITIKTFYPELDVVFDRDNALLKTLARRYHNKEYSTKTLSTRWNFQAVFSGDTVDMFYAVPIENRYEHVKKNITRDDVKDLVNSYGHWGVKLLNGIFSQKEDLIFNASRLGNVKKQYCQLFHYTNLWPNKQLEKIKKIQNS
jgi:hypothetical protein